MLSKSHAASFSIANDTPQLILSGVVEINNNVLPLLTCGIFEAIISLIK